MRTKSAQKRRKKPINYIKFFVFLLIVLVMISAIFLLRSRDWNGVDKFSFVSGSENDSIKVVVLDPRLGEEVTIIIPGDTEVEVSRGYGLMKIKNVRQFGKNEKIGSLLLAETITKNFYFPVKLVWFKDENNIFFIDRLKVELFRKKLSPIDRTEIDMAKSSYVKKTQLVDGSIGYKLLGSVSSRLTAYFSDNSISGQDVKIKLVDYGNKYGISEQVGNIIEVLGGKVVAIEKGTLDSDLDCTVSGFNNEFVKKVSSFFNCKVNMYQSNFDLEFKFGAKFSSRF